MKNAISLFLALLICLTLSVGVFASSEEPEEAARPASGIQEPEVEVRILANSAYVIDGDTVTDNRVSGEPGTDTYTSTSENGASAIYVTNGASAEMDEIIAYGNGTMSEEDVANENASKYGYSAAVLVNSPDAVLTLNDPTIVCLSGSTANGGFASNGATLVVNGGTITTNNSMGHGLDATYGAEIFAYETVIDTASGTSGALATDYGGGFITGERLTSTRFLLALLVSTQRGILR